MSNIIGAVSLGRSEGPSIPPQLLIFGIEQFTFLVVMLTQLVDHDFNSRAYLYEAGMDSGG